MKKLKNMFNAFVLVLSLNKVGQVVLGWKFVSNALDESAYFMDRKKRIESDEGMKMFEEMPLYIHLMIALVLPFILILLLFLNVFKKFFENNLEESIDNTFHLNFISLEFIGFIISLSIVWIAPKIIRVNGKYGHITKLANTLVKVFYKSLFIRVRKIVCKSLLKSYIFTCLLIFILFGNIINNMGYNKLKVILTRGKQRVLYMYPLF